MRKGGGPNFLSRLLDGFLGGGATGKRGERVAARFLKRRGLRILARNVRAGHGEIDIVAQEGSTLVFVEVKSRSERPSSELTGLERIDGRKEAALRRASALYRRQARGEVERYRLDAVTVEFEAGRGGRVRDVRWYPAVLDLDSDLGRC
jgi:putative endonuclease